MQFSHFGLRWERAVRVASLPIRAENDPVAEGVIPRSDPRISPIQSCDRTLPKLESYSNKVRGREDTRAEIGSRSHRVTRARVSSRDDLNGDLRWSHEEIESSKWKITGSLVVDEEKQETASSDSPAGDIFMPLSCALPFSYYENIIYTCNVYHLIHTNFLPFLFSNAI